MFYFTAVFISLSIVMFGFFLHDKDKNTGIAMSELILAAVSFSLTYLLNAVAMDYLK